MTLFILWSSLYSLYSSSLHIFYFSVFLPVVDALQRALACDDVWYNQHELLKGEIIVSMLSASFNKFLCIWLHLSEFLMNLLWFIEISLALHIQTVVNCAIVLFPSQAWLFWEFLSLKKPQIFLLIWGNFWHYPFFQSIRRRGSLWSEQYKTLQRKPCQNYLKSWFPPYPFDMLICYGYRAGRRREKAA